jgi:predicted RNA-binding protein with RPS1 domain
MSLVVAFHNFGHLLIISNVDHRFVSAIAHIVIVGSELCVSLFVLGVLEKFRVLNVGIL